MKADNLWNKGFGRLASRAAQTLLVLTLISILVLAAAYLSVVFIPILLATILACAMTPLVKLLQKMHIPRVVATLITFLLLAGTLTGAGFIIVNSIKKEWSNLSIAVTDGIDRVIVWLHSGALPIPVETVDEAWAAMKDYFSSSAFGQGALAGAGNIALVIAGLVLTLVILFYFLKDGERIWAFLISFLKPELHDKAVTVGNRSVNVLGGYIRGTTVVALIDALFIGIGLWILQVPLVIPLVILVFLGAYIPIIGATLAGIVAALVTLVTNDLGTAMIVAIIVVVVNQLEGNLIAPYVLGNALKLHSLVILLALAIGTAIGGIMGTLLAAPIAAVVWVAWKTWHEPAVEEAAEEIAETEAPAAAPAE